MFRRRNGLRGKSSAVRKVGFRSGKVNLKIFNGEQKQKGQFVGVVI